MEAMEEETSALSLEIKAFAEKNKDTQKYIDDLNFDITNLKISVSSFDESSLSIDEMMGNDIGICAHKSSACQKK